MFSSNRKTAVQNSNVETLIGASTKLTGNIEATGSVKVDGEYIGNITTKGDIIIGQAGSVKGDLNGANVVVAGKLEGNVKAAALLHISASGRMTGDLETVNLIVEDGGVVNGRVVMTLDEIKRIIMPDEK